jgi:hypothetical protein
MLAESRFDSKVGEFKARFYKMDKNKDNSLDFEEMKDLLRESRPNAKERELRGHFQEIDKGHRGKINFTEFCDFMYKDAPKGIKTKLLQKQTSLPQIIGFESRNRQGNLRHLRLTDEEIKNRLNSPTAIEAAGIDWEATSCTFYAYAGSDKMMQGNEFARLCRDCHFFDSRFSPGHAEHIFRKTCAKGETAFRKRAFRDALMLVATARNESATYIRNVVSHVVQHDEFKDSLDKFMIKSASATGLPETGRCRPLPRLAAAKAIDLDIFPHLHRRPSLCDVGYNTA